MNKKYFSASFLTIAASIINKAVAFILVALLTRLLSTEEFGEYSIFSSWVNIVTLIIGGSLASSFGIAKKDFKLEYDKYVSSSMGLSYILLVIVFIFGLIIKYNNLSFIFFLLVIIHSFNTNVITNYDVHQTFQFKFKKAFIISVSSTIFSSIIIIANVYFVNSDNKGLVAIIALTGSYFIFSLFCQKSMVSNGKCLYNKEFWLYAIRNSFWMIPHNLSLIILNQMDRIMIGRMLSNSYVAIYSAIYSLSIVISIIWTGIRKVWIMWIYDKLANNEYNLAVKINGILIIGVAIATINYCYITPEIIKIFLPNAYWDGMNIMAPILFGYFFSTLFSIYINIEYFYKKMKSIVWGTLLAAAVNMLSNFILIPLYGYKVSAYTTLFSYFILFLYHFILTYKYKYIKVKLILSISLVLATFLYMFQALIGLPILRYSIIVMLDISIMIICIVILNKKGIKLRKYLKDNLFGKN